MGIKYLGWFVTEVGLRRPHKLSDTDVVIDGNNILNYNLYEQYIKENPNDWLFGGNYTEYRKLFQLFFENLKQCNITPIIVFESFYKSQPNDNRMERFEQKFKLSKQLSLDPPILPKIETKPLINPFLLKETFKSVAKEMKEMKVFFFTTHFGCKYEMAKLANDHNCPLISNDSDLLIMDIKRGLISTDSLKWQNPLQLDDSQNNCHYIECKVYKVEDLIEFEYFEPTKNYLRLKRRTLRSELLPIFGSLLTNDYQLFDDLFEKIVEQTREVPLFTHQWNSRYYNHQSFRRMEQLLSWLCLYFNNAKEAILYIRKYYRRNKDVLKIFTNSLKSYDTNGKSYLKELLDNKLMAINEDEIPIDDIHYESQYEEFFQNSLLQSLRPLIEDFSLESVYESTIRLKRFRLGLLRTNHFEKRSALFMMRRGQWFKETLISPETHINCTSDGDKQLPIRSEIKNLSEIERKELLFNILEFKEEWVTRLEENLYLKNVQSDDIDFWKYFLIVITYWKSNSKMKRLSKFQFISAFVEKLIYFRHNSLISDDFNGMTSVEYCSGQEFKPFVIHYYCEIQSIYSSINNLVIILKYSIPPSKLHHYFNGILLYNLFNDIIDKPINMNPFKEERLNTIYNIIINSILNPKN